MALGEYGVSSVAGNREPRALSRAERVSTCLVQTDYRNPIQGIAIDSSARKKNSLENGLQ